MQLILKRFEKRILIGFTVNNRGGGKNPPLFLSKAFPAFHISLKKNVKNYYPTSGGRGKKTM